ncbi:2-aminoethanethiol dioxygenase [Petromyzon marinus]|uniref:2-aminoethanethiol dioxygenase n=1 Tax=Petromyzon marinus TaxID=7757 RepID=A0AAJ7TCJ5_PETMA|nr:2-aminoethanethiol dioxygenase [Petromyzon marinus]
MARALLSPYPTWRHGGRTPPAPSRPPSRPAARMAGGRAEEELRAGAAMAGGAVKGIFRQALRTFSRPSGARGSDPAAFAENLAALRALLDAVRPEDVNVAPRKGEGVEEDEEGAGYSMSGGFGPPPVSYMEIAEGVHFSMGIFVLRAGASIPLHDHPGMHGLLKVLYGELRLSEWDRGPPRDAAGSRVGDPGPPEFKPPLRAWQRPLVRASRYRGQQRLSPLAPCRLLTPHHGNLHRVDAVGGPAAFLDILAPPYSPDTGRDCHYYRPLVPATATPGHGLLPQSTAPLHHLHRDHGGNDDDHGGDDGVGEPCWLLEIPQPAEFWCGSQDYPGPPVI